MDIIKTYRSPNYESRRGCVPDLIVDHITAAATAMSSINWFTNPKSQASSNYIVDTDGTVYEMVPIDLAAWANGTTSNGDDRDYRKAANPIVRSRSHNANLYTVSIEHVNTGGGALTAPQLAASIELHKYIRAEVQRIYHRTIPADREHIIGHCEITPITRPNCPGKYFPWDKLMRGITGTAVPAIRTDTSGTISVAKGSYYQMRTFSPAGARVVAGNPANVVVVARNIARGDDGAEDWYLVPIGDKGSETGIYVSAAADEKSGKQCCVLKIG